jgi:small subunit ribosomal protein S3
MGQKVHPYGLRLGITTDWKSRWFADGAQYRDYIEQDNKIRDYLIKLLPHAAIGRIEIERTRERVRVTVHTARPGIVIGRRGAQADEIRGHLEKMEGKAARAQTGKDVNVQVNLDIVEVKSPDADAQLLSQAIAEQLSSRVSFRRAMRKAVNTAIKAGALGVKVQTSGRLGGAEMSRREGYHEGKVPLHTLRADIDFGFSESATAAGQIGVKVWIYKGEVIVQRESAARRAQAAQTAVQAPAAPPAHGGRERPSRPKSSPVKTTRHRPATPPAEAAPAPAEAAAPEAPPIEPAATDAAAPEAPPIEPATTEAAAPEAPIVEQAATPEPAATAAAPEAPPVEPAASPEAAPATEAAAPEAVPAPPQSQEAPAPSEEAPAPPSAEAPSAEEASTVEPVMVPFGTDEKSARVPPDSAGLDGTEPSGEDV